MDQDLLKERMCKKNGYGDTGGLSHCDYKYDIIFIMFMTITVVIFILAYVCSKFLWKVEVYFQRYPDELPNLTERKNSFIPILKPKVF